MAKIRAMIGSGGGSQTETLLWENQSPTSAFSSSTITLLESIASYDYLKIIYKSTASANDQFSLIVSVSDFRTTLSDNINPKVRLDAKVSSSAVYSRGFYYSSDTVINLASTNANQINGTGYSANYCIPLKVYGIKNIGANAPITDISVVGKTLLGTITTAGGTYTATEDCLMAGKLVGSSSANAYVQFNGSTVFSSISTAQIGYSTSSASAPDTCGMFVPKDTVVTTRSSGTYSLYFYSLK